MAYRGHLENGVVVFDEPVDLPEGATVRVEPAGNGGPTPEIDSAWSEFSLSAAMRGMELEKSPYTLADLKESFR